MFWVLLLVFGPLALCSTPSKEEKLAKEKAGFHCLSPYSGALDALIEAVSEDLRDPSSFDHVETRVTPRSAAGLHEILMTFRAKNGFGGTNVMRAKGTYRSDSCGLADWRMLD